MNCAEDLLALGLAAEAEGLARARLTADARALEEYVARAPRGERDPRRALAEARAALARGEAPAALALLPAARGASVSAAEAGAVAALCHAHAGDAVAEGAAWSKAASVAYALGWRRAERAALARALALVEGQDLLERRLLRRLLEIDDDARDLAASATYAARLGLIESRLLQPRLARGLLREADALASALTPEAGLAGAARDLHTEALATLARLDALAGDPAAALHYAQRAHERVANAPGRGDRVPARLRVAAARALSEAMLAVGRVEEARAFLAEALAAADEEPELVRYLLQGSLARLETELGRYAEAATLYDALEASPLATIKPRYGYVLRLHRAALLVEAGARLPEAVLQLARVLEDLAREPVEFAPRAELEANAQAQLGSALRRQGRAQDALGPLEASLGSAYAQQDAAFREFVERELGLAQLALGRHAEARRTLEQAVARLAEGVGALPNSLALSALGKPGVAELVEGYVACALERGAPAELEDALERTRGIVYLAEARRRVSGGSAAPAQAPLAPAALAQAIADAARESWRAREAGRRREIHSANERLYSYRRQLRDREESEALAASVQARGVEPAGPGGVAFRPRPALLAGEAFLYVAPVRGTYRMAVAWDGRVREAPLGPAAEVERRAREALETWVSPAGSQAPAALAALAALAADLVPAPIREHLGWGAPPAAGGSPGHLYLSVDGPLGALPWAALLETLAPAAPDPDAAGPGSAGPTFSRVASQAVLRHIRTWNPPATPGAPLLALGDPDYQAAGPGAVAVYFGSQPLTRLHHSRPEVEAIADPARGDLVLLGARASEDVLTWCLREAPYPFEVLHLSCHGLLQPRVPWLSALALHPSPESDGLLTVEEVGRWRFQGGPRLVVLAACESGRGAAVPGEGEDGLVRAFLLAGARQVVASLWKVPDVETARLMEEFHRALRQPGTSVPEALRRAQRAVAGSSPRSAHPYYWAAWGVWGPVR